jgi:hypothetical protein
LIIHTTQALPLSLPEIVGQAITRVWILPADLFPLVIGTPGYNPPPTSSNRRDDMVFEHRVDSQLAYRETRCDFGDGYSADADCFIGVALHSNPPGRICLADFIE